MDEENAVECSTPSGNVDEENAADQSSDDENAADQSPADENAADQSSDDENAADQSPADENAADQSSDDEKADADDVFRPDPGYGKLFHSLGAAMFAEGFVEQAQSCLERAIDLFMAREPFNVRTCDALLLLEKILWRRVRQGDAAEEDLLAIQEASAMHCEVVWGEGMVEVFREVVWGMGEEGEGGEGL